MPTTRLTPGLEGLAGRAGEVEVVLADVFGPGVRRDQPQDAAGAREGLGEHRRIGVRTLDDLRVGWELNLSFGLANPALYALMYGDPRPGVLPPAALAALEILGAHIHRIAEAGRHRVDEERATRLVHAVGGGTTLALIATPEDRRDLSVSRLAREAVIAAITTDAPSAAAPGPAGAAIALQALLPETTVLTAGEQLLLGELPARIAGTA